MSFLVHAEISTNGEKAARTLSRLAVLFSWAVALCGHAGVPAIELPAEVTMNSQAGLGRRIFLDLRLESAQTIRFGLDTGSPGTLLPRSVEPMLGKRLGTRRFATLDSKREVEHLYAAPKLYLGNTQLVTGARIGTWQSSIGVLGMDCLRHYCIQLDFQARKVRFLDSKKLDVAELGKAFPLTASPYAMIRHEGFFQSTPVDLLIDTGDWADGCVKARVFKRIVRTEAAPPMPAYEYQQLLKHGIIKGTLPGMNIFPTCAWDGQTYTNVIIGRGPDLLGLRFLARHLVTFDFPRGTMYLRADGALQGSSGRDRRD